MFDIIREDGYINATILCKRTKKRLDNWFRLDKTKDFINICLNYTNIQKDKLICVRCGKYGTTWIHPLLATNLAQWISNEFAIKVSLWIEEWKTINNNNFIYIDKINALKPDYFLQKEREIQLKLQKEIGGQIEVYTDSGYIDLLTDKEIIEIKKGNNWKEALGQILVYSIDFPKHKKRIHLFDIENNENINEKCKIYNIKVTYE